MTDRRTSAWSQPLGMAIVLGGFAALLMVFRAINLTGDAKIFRELAFLAFGGVVLYCIVHIEKRTLLSIGIRRPSPATLGWSLAATFVLIVITGITYTALTMVGLPTPGGDGGSGNPIWLVVVIAIRAAFVEELVFRGYVLERLESMGCRSAVAVLVSAALFVAAHLSAKLETIVFLVPAALFFGIFYVWKRDLIACMVAHAVVDFIGLAAAALQSR